MYRYENAGKREQDSIFHSLFQYYFKTCLVTNDNTV